MVIAKIQQLSISVFLVVLRIVCLAMISFGFTALAVRTYSFEYFPFFSDKL